LASSFWSRFHEKQIYTKKNAYKTANIVSN
jgi:hypothetical protein